MIRSTTYCAFLLFASAAAAAVVAGDDIDSITAANITDTIIAAGFNIDLDTTEYAASGYSGDIRRMTLTASDITNTTIAASDDILYTSSAQRLTGDGTIANTLFSAGFGPGPDGVFATADDEVVRTDGRIGNIGSASNRFAVIDGTFRATGNIYDLNSAGDVSADVWSMKDVDDIRSGGTLSGTVAAGDDIDSIVADLITSPLISAGYLPGADGVFGWGGDDVLSGMSGDIRGVTSANDITATFRASRDIRSIESGGILGTGTLGDDWIFAGNDILGLWSAGDLGARVSAGTLSGTGVIGQINVDEQPDDWGGPDCTVLDTVFANLRIDVVRVEAATSINDRFTGVAPDSVVLDTDGDGA